MALSSKTLFVRNLPYSTTDAQLEQTFSRHGALKACFTVKGKGTSDSCRGFAYVTYENKGDALKAKSSVKVLGGRPLQIVFARQRETRVEKKKDLKEESDERNSDGDGERDSEDGGEMEESDSEEDYETLTSKEGKERGRQKNKRKTNRGDAKFDVGRVVVISNLSEQADVKQLRKECEQSGNVESLEFPVPEREIPSAYVTYSTHKEARLAVIQLNGVFLSSTEAKVSAQLLSKEGKRVSKKSLKKSRLIVRNLSFKCSESDVRKVFEKYGPVVEVHIPRKPNGHMLGYAFVQFGSFFAARNALGAVNATEIKGRPVAVDWVVSKDRYEQSVQTRDEREKGEGEKARDDDSIEEPEASPLSGESDAESHDSEDESHDNEDESHDSEDESHDEDEDGTLSHDSDALSLDGDEVGDSDLDTSSPKRNDTTEGRTVFIRNLPLGTEHKDLKKLFYQFGRVRYCRVMLNRDTGLCTGSAFVQFKEQQSAKACLQAATANGDQGFTYCGHRLDVNFALSRDEMERVSKERDDGKSAKGEDRRNLYLAKEGVILPGSKAADDLSKTDMARRMKVYAQKKSKLTNPYFFVSKTRLSVHNLPVNVDEQRLKRVFLQAAGDEQARINQVKILRSSDRVNSKGIGRSLGYGFIEFTTHEAALAALRGTNNNPSTFGEKRRLIVEFAVEDSRAIKLREKRRQRQIKPTSTTSSRVVEAGLENGNVEPVKPLSKRQKWKLKCKAKRLRRRARKNALDSTRNNQKEEVDEHGDKPRPLKEVSFKLLKKRKHQFVSGSSCENNRLDNETRQVLHSSGGSIRKVQRSAQITNPVTSNAGNKLSRKRKRKRAESKEEEAFAVMVDRYRRKLQRIAV